jgi:phage FluMu protein Com
MRVRIGNQSHVEVRCPKCGEWRIIIQPWDEDDEDVVCDACKEWFRVSDIRDTRIVRGRFP